MFYPWPAPPRCQTGELNWGFQRGPEHRPRTVRIPATQFAGPCHWLIYPISKMSGSDYLSFCPLEFAAQGYRLTVRLHESELRDVTIGIDNGECQAL